MAPKTQQKVLPLGPWKGVRDVGDAGQQSAGFLQDAVNCYWDQGAGGTVLNRPGFTTMATLTGNPGGQAVHTHVDSTGTVRNFVVAEGKLYRGDSTLSTWTEVASGFTSDAGFPVWLVSFGDELILNDMNQRPQRLTNLGSTPVTKTSIQYDSSSTDWRALGAPTVYGGKVFFIVYEYPQATPIASRIVWSEERDSSTGYAQTGYTNVWDLVQTGAGRIWNIVGTNTALYYFRSHSIGAISGAVNTTFTTTSTHDAVSQTIGSPYYKIGVCKAGNWLYFMDEMFRLHRFAIGGQLSESSELWKDMRYRLRLNTQGGGANSMASAAAWGRMVYHTGLGKVVFTMANEDGTSTKPGRALYVFDAEMGRYEGRWIIGTSPPPTETGFAAVFIEAIGELTDSNLLSRFVIIGSDGSSSTYTNSTSGGVIQMQDWITQDSAPFTDSAGTQQARITVQAFHSTTAELSPRLVRLACKTGTTTPTITLKYFSPYTNGSSALSATPTGAPDATLSTDEGSVDREDYLRAEAKWGLGPNAKGRWLTLQFTGSSSGRNQFGFEYGEVVGQLSRMGPTSP